MTRSALSRQPTDPSLGDLPRNEDGFAITADALAQLENRIPAFLEAMVADAGADRLVVVLDGSVEATLAAAFAVDAVGAEHVTGLVMPAFISQEATARNAETIASTLGITHHRVQLHPVLAAFQEAIGEPSGQADDLAATNNALSRLRMVAAYYVANATNALVVGAVNRSEYLLGSVTKHAETAVDCLLFANLYQTETYALASHLDIPTELMTESTVQDTLSATIDRELSSETIDQLLRLHVDREQDRQSIANRIDVDYETVDRLVDRCARTAHKRQQPAVPTN